LTGYEINIRRTIDLRLGSHMHDNWALTLVNIVVIIRIIVEVINNCFVWSLFATQTCIVTGD